MKRGFEFHKLNSEYSGVAMPFVINKIDAMKSMNRRHNRFECKKKMRCLHHAVHTLYR